LLNKSKRGEANKRNYLIQVTAKKIQLLPRWEGSGTFRASVAASLVHNTASLSASSNQPQLTPAALTRGRCAFLLLKPSRPPSSTLPSSTIIFFHQLASSHQGTSPHTTTTTPHTFHDADLRQDP
jgi:hypothetical protein